MKSVIGVLPRKGDTVASVLDRFRGMGPGFDLMHVVLAFMVFYVHTCALYQAAPPPVVEHARAALGGASEFIATAHNGMWMGGFPRCSSASCRCFSD
jgi:hypothetical protein